MSTSLCPEKASHVLKQVAGDSSAVWKPNHVILRNIKMLSATSTRLALFCHPALHRASQGADTGFANSLVMLLGPALPKMSQGQGLMGLKGQTLLPQVSQYGTQSVQTDLSQNWIVNKNGNTEPT